MEIDGFEPLEDEPAGIGGIFADLSNDRMRAARKALAYFKAGGDPKAFTDAAQRLIYLKGRDSHDYKFSSAIIEDHQSLPPGLRERFLAASVFWLKGSDAAENPLVARSRAAL